MALQAPSLLNMSFLPTTPRPAAPRQDNQSADILNALMLAGLMSEAEDYRAGLNALTQPDAPAVNPLGVLQAESTIPDMFLHKQTSTECR